MRLVVVALGAFTAAEVAIHRRVASGRAPKSRPDGIACYAHGRYRHASACAALARRCRHTTRSQAPIPTADQPETARARDSRRYGTMHLQRANGDPTDLTSGTGSSSRVFEAPYGVQLSPVVQWASARAYNLTAGTDLDRDGNNNDRWIDPSTGQQVWINSARGDQTFVVDVRTTKFIPFGGDRRPSTMGVPTTATDEVRHSGSRLGTFPASGIRGRCS
jgi:hypothetical protein